jgi:hypothetical protein
MCHVLYRDFYHLKCQLLSPPVSKFYKNTCNRQNIYPQRFPNLIHTNCKYVTLQSRGVGSFQMEQKLLMNSPQNWDYFVLSMYGNINSDLKSRRGERRGIGMIWQEKNLTHWMWLWRFRKSVLESLWLWKLDGAKKWLDSYTFQKEKSSGSLPLEGSPGFKSSETHFTQTWKIVNCVVWRH